VSCNLLQPWFVSQHVGGVTSFLVIVMDPPLLCGSASCGFSRATDPAVTDTDRLLTEPNVRHVRHGPLVTDMAPL
jgi:hypothetical protein